MLQQHEWLGVTKLAKLYYYPAESMTPFEIIPFELAKDWLGKLTLSLRERRADRKAQIDKVGNIFGDPFELAAFYVEPDCQQFNPADYTDEDSYHVVREPIFDRISQFLSGRSDRSGKHLFVLSDAGTGKTSLLVMLKLSHINALWSKPYDCELLKIGVTTADDIRSIERKASTVLLLDGLDEDPLSWDKQEARLRELLSLTTMFHRTIITCRTQFLRINQDPFMRRGRIEVYGHLCPVIYTSLFSDRQVKKYLNRRFEDRLQSKIWESKAFEIVQKMGYLSMRPMLLAHIDALVESDQNEWTLYAIYKALINSWLLREQQKIFDSQKQSFPIAKLLDGCRHAAFVMQSQGRPLISQDELETHAKLYSGIAGISLMQLGVRSLLARNTDGYYRFAHYSILEYLIVDSIIIEFATPLINGIKPTALMRAFAASWIQSNHLNRGVVNSLKRIGIQGAVLCDSNLAGIDLSEFDCSGVDFSNANLEGANLSNTILKGATFLNANLRMSTFDGAKIANVNFDFADASLARFGNTYIQQSTFSETNLRSASFENSTVETENVLRNALCDANTNLPKYREDWRRDA